MSFLVLSGTFKEGQFGNIDGGFPEDQPKVISDYDYDSDSDFDLGEETDVEEFGKCKPYTSEDEVKCPIRSQKTF